MFSFCYSTPPPSPTRSIEPSYSPATEVPLSLIQNAEKLKPFASHTRIWDWTYLLSLSFPFVFYLFLFSLILSILVSSELIFLQFLTLIKTHYYYLSCIVGLLSNYWLVRVLYPLKHCKFFHCTETIYRRRFNVVFKSMLYLLHAHAHV